jgi:hypothetical protein
MVQRNRGSPYTLLPALWPGKHTVPVLNDTDAFSSSWDLTILKHLARGGIGPALVSFRTLRPSLCTNIPNLLFSQPNQSRFSASVHPSRMLCHTHQDASVLSTIAKLQLILNPTPSHSSRRNNPPSPSTSSPSPPATRTSCTPSSPPPPCTSASPPCRPSPNHLHPP